MKNKLLKNFKIYVAGHNGMVGRAVIRYLKNEGVKNEELGLYIIRGDNVSVIGEIDKELENKIDYNTLYGEKIKPVKH